MVMVHAKCCHVIFKKQKTKIVIEINTLPVFNSQTATMCSLNMALAAWLRCCCCCLYGFNWIVSCTLAASIFRFIAAILSFFDKMFVPNGLLSLHCTSIHFKYILHSLWCNRYTVFHAATATVSTKFWSRFYSTYARTVPACHCCSIDCTHTRALRWLCCQWMCMLFVWRWKFDIGVAEGGISSSINFLLNEFTRAEWLQMHKAPRTARDMTMFTSLFFLLFAQMFASVS